MGQQLRAALQDRLPEADEHQGTARASPRRGVTSGIRSYSHQLHPHGVFPVILPSPRPTRVEHRFHVERDKNGKFKNLPPEWASKVNYSVSENS